MSDSAPKIPFNDETRAKSSIKSLNFELSNLTPSALVTMFEIDLNKLIQTKGINLQEQARDVNFGGDVNDGILRFHNNINIFNSYIIWRGKTYYPAPIAAEGFEASTKGVLPQPSLTIASQSETGADQLALLKHEIKKFGDIIGSKVTRRRTFAKYLDRRNFLAASQGLLNAAGAGNTTLPQGYEPDPYAELPIDVYFIERKQTENKNVLTYQLSSVLDMEGTKIPKRVIVSDKCVWQYRGIGCWYQCKEKDESSTYSSENFPPLLKKAEISKLGAGGTNLGLPQNASAVANDKDEKIKDILQINAIIPRGPWKENESYRKGDSVYISPEGDHIKYYFVCKKDGTIGSATIPPNAEHWIADECSKSLTGCRLRWGAGKGAANDTGCAIQKGELPFGGFPAARKMSRLG
jgi:lambda family phage minor tail protein L